MPSIKKEEKEKGMAFSSFAHIPDLRSLEFAVVLREEGNGEDIVARMLPMSRIVPGPPLEKKVRSPQRSAQCVCPDCVSQRLRLQELKDFNEGLMDELEESQVLITTATDKLEVAEKKNRSIEAQNEELEQQLNELDQRTALLEIEAEDGQRQKRELKKKVSQLDAEIDKLRKQTEERIKERELALRSNQCEVVFGEPKFHSLSSPPAVDEVFVNSLDLWDGTYGGSTGKQNDFISSLVRPSTTPGRTIADFKMPTPPYLTTAMTKIRPKTNEVKGKLRLSQQRGGAATSTSNFGGGL